MTTSAIRREAQFIGAKDEPLFAVFHVAEGVAPRDGVAVICNPIGYEYMHAHRTLRHLADGLARSGVPALRFDYHGTGDSPGNDLDADRLERWLHDIRTAIAFAQAASGSERICLIGLRLGASLAAMATETVAVDQLVLWNPCVSGRRYVREMQAIAQSAALSMSSAPGVGEIEPAGFMMSSQTQEQLKALQLVGRAAQVKNHALVVTRDDAPSETQLLESLCSRGIVANEIVFSGYAEMMAEPQKSQVPLSAVMAIAQQVSARLPMAAGTVNAAPGHRSMQFGFTAQDGKFVRLHEQAHRFGEDPYLFGIYCQPEQPGAADASGPHPTVVMFNAGVTHHVGPNRLYVEMARNLASRGLASFRCDIEGIGESVLREDQAARGIGRENHPYPETADRDAAEVLRYLSQHLGVEKFVAMGLCSGAYTAFHTGLSEKAWPIAELLMINPLTFDWKEGDSLETRHFSELAHYKGTMRKLDSWKKLLRGQIDFAKVARVAIGHVRKQVASRAAACAERWLPSRGPRLSRELRQLFARGIFVSMFIASGEPGWDMMSSKARYTAKQAVKDGTLRLRFVVDADHTFSSLDSRTRVIAKVRDHLLERFPTS